MPRFALFKTSFTGAKTGRTTDCITNHWTRVETATLLSRNLLSLMLRGGGFARVSSIVVLLLVATAKHVMKICFVSILSFAALLFVPSVAFACSCELPPRGKTEKQLIKLARENSQTVFIGEVAEIILEKTTPGEDAPVAEVRFKVSKSWKGAAKETATVFTANICCICGYTFKVGERYLVYTYNSSDGTKLYTNICTRTKPLAEADKDLRVLGKAKVSQR